MTPCEAWTFWITGIVRWVFVVLYYVILLKLLGLCYLIWLTFIRFSESYTGEFVTLT